MQKNLLQSVTPELNSNTLFSRLTDWFDRNDWSYDEHGSEEEGGLSAGVSCSNGTWRLIARVNEELRHVYFWSVLDICAPEDRRMAVAEFITRANYGKRIGFFEMDWRDGEIRLNVSFGIADGELTDMQIERAVDDALIGMDRYFVALMGVIYGGREPLEALDAMRERLAEASDSADGAKGVVH